ncbi:MAG: 3'-5' exonuclease, partial [Candidatus Electrothrix sp. AR3]|nr:3'-5' exonuclease [Candidatus Electrothrix sp. AR3]
MISDFIVLDTEGRDTITEIALIDHQGDLLFEGFVEGGEVQHDTYQLPDLLKKLVKCTGQKKLICHYAEHDEEVLRKSFAAAELAWPKFSFVCTCELAKKCFANLSGYSLEYLSKSLQLQVDRKYFNPQAAHGAQYDAQFTLELYRKIQQQQRAQSIISHNPFSNTRVDSPFQQHPDLDAIHHHAFTRITTLLEEIKNDPNQQSQGVVILGEAGNGKTHLMMRLARHTLENNRLFFIRQPNHEQAVFYHIYSRMLESFIETIPGTDYSQLEYLLGRSFSGIVINALKNKVKP